MDPQCAKELRKKAIPKISYHPENIYFKSFFFNYLAELQEKVQTIFAKKWKKKSSE